MTGAPLFALAPLAALSASCVVPVGNLHESSSPFIHVGTIRSWDALDYQLALQLEEDVGRLRGVVRVDFEILSPTHQIILDAVDFTIEKVTAGGSSTSWAYDGQFLAVEFSDWLRPGDKGWLEISYSTTPTAGFFFETPGVTGVDQPAHVYTQGECEDARRWFPCNDSPADRATHSLEVIIPASWTSVAAGRQTQERLLENGRKIVHWQLEYPVPPYLFTFAAGEFLTLQDSAAGVPLYFLVEPGDESAARATFARTGAILEFFSAYTEFPYPFSKYAQTIVRGFPFGAMENVSATTAGRSMLSADQISRPTWPTVAHELAHQWFGDIITCSSWPHIWLNEGFATYFTLLYGRHSEGEEEFLWQMGATVDSYLAACSGDHRRALVKKEYRVPMDLFFDGTVYPGGASRLQLLRGWTGETVFQSAVARYLRENAWTSVESDALRRAFEREGASDMALFFRQWVQGVGYPELRLSWSTEGEQLQVDVEQEHPAADPSGNPLSRAATPWAFRFPLDLRWRSLGGDWDEQRVWVSRRSQSFSLPVPGGVEFLVFDPWVYLPARLHVDEPRSATLARLVHGVISRDRQLALRRLLILNILPDSDVLAEILADASVHPSLRAEILRAVPSLARRPSQLDEGLDPFEQAQVRLVLQQPDHPDFLSLETDLLATSAAPAALRAIAIRTAGKRIPEPDLLGFLRQWLLDPSSPSPERRAALDVVVDRFPDSRTLALLVNLASRGRPGSVRADAVAHLPLYLDEYPSTRLVVARAMMSPEVPLRRAAASVAVKRPKLFAKAMTARLKVEPNSGIRRQLEQGLKALD